MMLPKKLQNRLLERKSSNAFRQLGQNNNLVDFSSNDYLGFSISKTIYNRSLELLSNEEIQQNGATGSRLLTGNHKLYRILETNISEFHNTEAALVFNSGYVANIGFFSTVPQRGDIILYDEFCHASIRDGIQMSNAKAYKFRHNNLNHLKDLLERILTGDNEVYIVTESVFSMDGDTPNLKVLLEISEKSNTHLIIDEAHAVGVFGKGLADFPVFARILTFGKALGCHGAAILGSQDLKDYLVNFSRSLIYTTGLPPHSVATISAAYHELMSNSIYSKKLISNINFFKSEIIRLNLQNSFIKSSSAIHSCIIPTNNMVKLIAKQLEENGFNIKPILSPTVPVGKERLRFCLHSYNSKSEITRVLELLANFIKKVNAK